MALCRGWTLLPVLTLRLYCTVSANGSRGEDASCADMRALLPTLSKATSLKKRMAFSALRVSYLIFNC